MNIHFDEHTLKEIGRKYDTYVTMTDYVGHMDVFQGSLNSRCFSMIKFYLNNHLLDGCTWRKREIYLSNGWTKLITEAINSTGDEVFNITVIIKDKVDVSRVGEAPVRMGWFKSFAIGFVAGFFPIDKVLEVIGAGWLLNQVTRKKED
jgi:hypothetical protein